jgi:hypothetical protein
VLWRVGEKSAEFTLGEGRLRGTFRHGEAERFLRSFPNMWKSSYSEGEVSLLPGASGTYDVRLSGISSSFRNGYFEFVSMAFLKRGLELLGATVDHQALKSFSGGDEESLYRLTLS